MNQKCILVVEDEETLREALGYHLAKEGYGVLTASDGIEALEVAREANPDLILLDIMLPRLSGFDVCRILRKETSTPILILTAKDSEVDKVVGLELGADDYVTKPFSLRELMARIRAMLRRTEVHGLSPSPLIEEKPRPIKFGDLQLDLAGHVVTLKGSPVTLKPKEFDLLAFLAINRGLVLSRDTLLEKVWGFEFAGDTRTVDVHVRWLREKIEEYPSKPRRIVTVRGVGYKFEG